MNDVQKTVIKVMGLGGGGSNAVDRMIELGIDGVDFIAANTDAQALNKSQAPVKLILGQQRTRGLGAGGNPEVGEAAAIESRDEIAQALGDADLVFLTAGMGGGTGTGSIAVAAQVARSLGALTIAIVTTPFTFEGSRREKNANYGLAKLRSNVDTLIMVANDRLLAFSGKTMRFEFSLRVADEALRQGVQGIAEIVTKAGQINNLDFAHIRSLMQCSGGAMMAIGEGKGENKALAAVRQALRMPLLNIPTIENACGVLVNFTGGEDLGLFEINQAMEEVNRAAPNANVVFGTTLDASKNGCAQVILIATGVAQEQPLTAPVKPVVKQTATVAAPRPQPQPQPQPQPAHLAEALFTRAAPDPLAQPWVVADTHAPNLNAKTLDVPAFIRRRNSLRDFEGKQA
jgi:cell division protein FtsZ